MNVTIRTRSGRPPASDGIIADQARKRCRCEKRDDKYQKLHGSFVFSLILVEREELAGGNWGRKDSRLCQSSPPTIQTASPTLSGKTFRVGRLPWILGKRIQSPPQCRI